MRSVKFLFQLPASHNIPQLLLYSENCNNFARWITSMPQMPGCAGTSLTNVIYTKLSTFPSSKISLL